MSQPNPQEEIAIALENFWSQLTPRTEQDLMAYFINEREYEMEAITKKNFLELFERWSATLSLEDLLDIL